MRLRQSELLRIIAERECPFCERAKFVGAMFCDACYWKLPKGIRDRIANGLRALSEALKDGVRFMEG